MRVGRLLPVLAVVAVTACGGGDGSGGPASTGSAPSTETPTSPTPVPFEPSESTTPPQSTIPTTVSIAPSEEPELPGSWLRYGADGLFLLDADGEQLLVDRPIGWATSDGAGGALFTDWNPDRFGPTRWLPGGASDPVVVSEWDDPLLAALVDGRPAAVGALPTSECESDGEGHMVAHLLVTGERATLQCGVGGQDSGRGPDSYGGGLYVGVEWNAVHSSGRSTAVRLVFRDESGEVVELPTNPFSGDCSPCELSAALSPDGTRLTVVHRRDAPPFRPDGWDDWLASTASIDAELRVFDLATGETLFSRSLTAGRHPATGSWFDGRFVVVGPDAFQFPQLAPGDRGDAVRTLQRLLVENGADIEIDGVFGPGTQAAVEAFHDARFDRPRATAGPDTWAELGVPSTIIDVVTGATTDVAGRIALEVILADGPAPGVEWTSAEIDGADRSSELRSDGLGPFAFGADADDVDAWLVERLGEPDAAIVEEGQGGWPLESCNERRFSYWAAAGLTVGFTDLAGHHADGTAAECDDAPHLAGWYVVDEGPPWFAPGHGETSTVPVELRLTTREGIGLGASAGHLRAAESIAAFGEWDIDDYAPATFRTASGMRGRVAWDPVADVQSALNQRGAELTVDGAFGPRTQAALAELQASIGIDEAGIGPLTLDALDVDVPDDAPITYLSAGTWDWGF